MTATIELNLLSGFPNHTWEVRADVVNGFLDALSKLRTAEPGFQPIPGYAEPLGRPRSGYRGLELRLDAVSREPSYVVFGNLVLDVRGSRVLVDAQDAPLEQFLYRTAPPATIGELNGLTYGQLKAAHREDTIAGIEDVPIGLACRSGLTFLGDAGDWDTFQNFNTCYNYATNVVNATTAKQKAAAPGTPNITKSFTEAQLRNALLQDGLDDLGRSLPRACPPAGSHYIAVVIRHDPTGTLRDYHCLRLDRHGIWSHKDGGGEVRDVDDRGDQIVDLRTAAFGWTPTLVGFYRFSGSDRRRIG